MLLPVDPVELIMVAVIALIAVILYRTVRKPLTRLRRGDVTCKR